MNKSKNKGRKGEHQAARMLGGKRTPLSGGDGGGDVTLPSGSLWSDWSIEVKRRAKIGGFSLEMALNQARKAMGIGSRQRPMVFARADYGPWYIFVQADDLISWVEALAETGMTHQIRASLRNIKKEVSAIEEVL